VIRFGRALAIMSLILDDNVVMYRRLVVHCRRPKRDSPVATTLSTRSYDDASDYGDDALFSGELDYMINEQ